MPRATSHVQDNIEDVDNLNTNNRESDEDSSDEKFMSPRSPTGCSDQDIEDAVENLSNKHGYAQEAGINTLMGLLRKHVCLDGVGQRMVSLFEGLRRIIHTPRCAAKLRADAARAVAAALLALDDVPVAIFNEMAEELTRVALDRSTPEPVVVQGLRTLLFAALLAPHSDDDSATHPSIVLQVFSRFITTSSTVSPTIVGTAIECFGLLSANSNINELKNQKKLLAKLVGKPVPEIVVPAAESLALVAQQGVTDDDEQLQEVLNDVERMIETLNKDAIRTTHKDTRKAQKAALRRVLAQLTGDGALQEKFAVGQRLVVFNRWSQVLTANLFRDLLGGGFPMHLLLNPRVQGLLGVDDLDLKQKKRSKAEKAVMMADLAAAAKERRLARNQRTRQFGTYVGEDE